MNERLEKFLSDYKCMLHKILVGERFLDRFNIEIKNKN